MSPAIAFALILLGLLLAGIGIERIARKIARYYHTYPNRRSGWSVPVNKVHDASCKSGWLAHTQRGHRY